jgi:RNA polymerase sigma-70 factor (ECF subfamily)
MAELSPDTPLTLLERLCRDPRDEAAWTDFVTQYQPRIRQWCLNRGVQPTDADDIAQIVLSKLAETMRAFQYDPAKSFRAWLKTVTHNALVNFLTSEQRNRWGGSNQLDSLESQADFSRRLQAAFDHELLELALSQVRQRVEPHTFEAFRLTALEGLTGVEAAGRLGIPAAHVFVAKHRVQKLIQDFIRRHEADSDA